MERRETVIGPSFLESDYDGAAILPLERGVYGLVSLFPDNAQWTRSAHAHHVDGTRLDDNMWRDVRAHEPPMKLYRVRVVVEIEEVSEEETQALLALERAKIEQRRPDPETQDGEAE